MPLCLRVSEILFVAHMAVHIADLVLTCFYIRPPLKPNIWCFSCTSLEQNLPPFTRYHVCFSLLELGPTLAGSIFLKLKKKLPGSFYIFTWHL